MPDEGGQAFAGGDVPETRAVVLRYGYDLGAIGAEGGNLYRAFMAREDGQEIPGVGVPEAHRVVV